MIDQLSHDPVPVPADLAVTEHADHVKNDAPDFSFSELIFHKPFELVSERDYGNRNANRRADCNGASKRSRKINARIERAQRENTVAQ